MSPQNDQTQRLFECPLPPDTPNRCIMQDNRISNLEDKYQAIEARLLSVEKLHSALTKLSGDVSVLNERVKLLLWVSATVGAGIILSLIAAIFALITKGLV